MIDALWTISRKVKAQPGEVQNMVLSHSWFNARHLAAQVCGDEGPEVWLNEKATTLTRIGEPVAGFGHGFVSRTIPEENTYPSTKDAVSRVFFGGFKGQVLAQQGCEDV